MSLTSLLYTNSNIESFNCNYKIAFIIEGTEYELTSALDVNIRNLAEVNIAVAGYEKRYIFEIINSSMLDNES